MATNRIAYNAEYSKTNYDRLTLRLPKGSKEKLQFVASLHGESVNAIIIDAIEKQYNLDLKTK